MPRVKRVVARKDHPLFNISKGELHYYWVLKTGPRSSRTFRQVEPPKPAQLTTSEFLQSLYGIMEGFSTISEGSDCASLAEELETLAEETREKFENMPEGLQQGDIGQLLEERAEACETAAGELTDAEQELLDFENAKAEWEKDPLDEDNIYDAAAHESRIAEAREISVDAG